MLIMVNKVCPTCKIDKNISEFYSYNDDAYSKCKDCHNKYVSERWVSRKLDAIKDFGNQCQDCKQTFNYYVYDFFYKDDNKDFIWNQLREMNKDFIKEELKKCILLCANCSRVRNVSKIKSKVKKNNDCVLDNTSAHQQCFKCKIDKNLKDFYFRKSRGNYSTICKICSDNYNSIRQVDFKNKYLNLMGGKCIDCNKTFESCQYDFHHLRDKDHNWNTLKRQSEETIKKELEKCVLLCSNCHRERHHKNGANVVIEIQKNEVLKEVKLQDREIEKNKQLEKEKEIAIQKETNPYYTGREHLRKVQHPTKEELHKLIWEFSTVKIAKQFGVSDKAVEKWCKKYGIDKPSRGYWAKQYAEKS
jgi:hypothetical protein